MQPVFRSSTTSLISPISSPWAVFTFEPMILLVCTYVVDVLVVLVVWAFETSGAMAKPTMASKAPRQKEVFITNTDVSALWPIQTRCAGGYDSPEHRACSKRNGVVVRLS